jgi:anti-sigma B factor antagonist
VNELSFTVEREPERAVVVAIGVVTIATSGEFERALLGLAADTDVVVDLRALTFVDSSGLSVFVAAYKEGLKHGNTVVLDHVPPFVARVLKVTGLGTFLLAPQRVV